METFEEFEFNNQMYDIVDKVISKDSVQYWCWWDFKETKLNKQLDELLVGVFNMILNPKKSKIYFINFTNRFIFNLFFMVSFYR